MDQDVEENRSETGAPEEKPSNGDRDIDTSGRRRKETMKQVWQWKNKKLAWNNTQQNKITFDCTYNEQAHLRESNSTN